MDIRQQLNLLEISICQDCDLQHCFLHPLSTLHPNGAQYLEEYIKIMEEIGATERTKELHDQLKKFGMCDEFLTELREKTDKKNKDAS